MKTRRVLSIPVYSRTRNEHAASFERVKEKEIAAAAVHGAEWQAEKARRVHSADATGWYRWQYNDIAAWITVYVVPTGFYLDVCERDRPVRHPPRKIFEHYDHATTRVHTYGSRSSAEMERELRESIMSIPKSKGWPRTWHVDMMEFNVLASVIDWQKLTRST